MGAVSDSTEDFWLMKGYNVSKPKKQVKQTLHDLHECYSSIVDGVRKERWISTIATNLPYRLQRHKKLVLTNSPNYPKGTFFVITDNGVAPELNKHLKKGSLL